MSPSRRRTWLVAGVSTVAIAAVATLPLHPVRSYIERPAIEGLFAGILACDAVLALTRFRTTRATRFLLIGTGLAVVSMQTIVFGAFWITAAPRATFVWERSALPSLAWSFAWVLAGLCFLLGTRPLPIDAGGRLPAITVIAAAAAALATGDLLLVALRKAFPAISSSALTTSNPFALASPTHWVFALAAFALLFASAMREARVSPDLRGSHGWFAAAWSVAAVAQFTALAWPIAFRPIVAFGDAVPFGAAALALAALLSEQHADADRTRRATEVLEGRAGIASMASHELRGPVTTIIGLASTAHTHYLRLGDDERREFLGLIGQESDRLLDTVGQISTALRVDAGTLTYDMRTHEVAEVARSAIQVASTGDHPVSLTADEALRVRADRKWLEDAVRQLIDNAARFSPRESPIEVRVHADGGAAAIEVVDAGPGIPPEEREGLFEKFARWRPDGYEQTPGSGLGLFICAGIVRDHGGDVMIAEGPSGGTMLRIRVPAVPAEA